MIWHNDLSQCLTLHSFEIKTLITFSNIDHDCIFLSYFFVIICIFKFETQNLSSEFLSVRIKLDATRRE